MQKYKFGFWLFFVLVLGLCAILWASDKDAFSQHKLNWMKRLQQLPGEAKTALPPDLWVSQKPQESAKIMAGTGAISGHVTKAAGGGSIEGVTVWAEQLECLSHVYSGTSDFSGFYVIDTLLPGNYKVYTDNDSEFVDIYWDNQPNWEKADTVVVASNDTTEDKNFSLRVGGKIAGTVTLPTFASMTVDAIDTSSRETYSEFVSYIGFPTPYVIKRLPTGTYKVQTGKSLFLPGDYSDVYYNNDSTWAAADPVSVTEGSTTSPINFSLSLGGKIKGNISTAKGPLNDVLVWGYYASNPDWFSFGSTDENGNYELIGVRSGYWKIFAYGDTTYAFEWYDDQNTWNNANSVLVTAPDSAINKNFTLEIGGSISGHVYDLGGSPLSGCGVLAFENSVYAISLQLWTTKWDTTSSYDGSYKISGLRTGDYKIAASTECNQQWYDHKSTWDQATVVHVTMPHDTSGIDFNLSTAVEGEEEVTQRPSEFELYQNYPNPFNPGTQIEFALKKTGHVSLQIYNVLGEKVKTLLDQDQPAGFYQINWDGKNDNGKPVSSGIYLYKLEVNGFSEAKKMLLLK